MDLWKAYTTTNLNAVIAPLQDNVFNRSKSNIKYLEAACCGVPGVFQDMVTYKEAPLRFTKGPDLIDQLKFLLKSEDNYVKYSLDARKYAETMWLDDHLDEYTELYNTGFDEPRSALSRLNPRATPYNNHIICYTNRLDIDRFGTKIVPVLCIPGDGM